MRKTVGGVGDERIKKYPDTICQRVDVPGAVSVLYELGGIVVICDAGGCTGNVCGFDEPRWFETRSAIFSAGLRDMDAILEEMTDWLQNLQMRQKSWM